VSDTVLPNRQATPPHPTRASSAHSDNVTRSHSRRSPLQCSLPQCHMYVYTSCSTLDVNHAQHDTQSTLNVCGTKVRGTPLDSSLPVLQNLPQTLCPAVVLACLNFAANVTSHSFPHHITRECCWPWVGCRLLSAMLAYMHVQWPRHGVTPKLARVRRFGARRVRRSS
jgi:hypothetical protein